MKKKLLILLSISLLIFFTACSENGEDDPTEPTDGTSAEQYYPGGVGSVYTYSGEATDTNNVTTNYQREATYTETRTENGTNYIVQSNLVIAGPSTTSGEFIFRTTSTGMFIYIDASVFQEVIDSSGIDPDLVNIQADPEVRLIAYPFSDTPNWDAFIVKASALGGLVNLNLLELKGNYRGQETLSVMGSDMTAEKIEYIATLRIPESIEDISNPEVITVTANAWFVKDVGLVKIEGSGLIAGAFGTGELEFEGEGGTVSEVLTSYQIQ